MKKKKPNAEPKRRGSRCSITFVEFETYLASYIYQHIYTMETINSPRCKDRRQSMGSEIEEPAINLQENSWPQISRLRKIVNLPNAIPEDDRERQP